MTIFPKCGAICQEALSPQDADPRRDLKAAKWTWILSRNTPLAAVYLTLTVLYFYIVFHKPWSLWPSFAHDDGLYVGLAESLVRGDWLGTYNDRTLAKPPGFSLFIALSSISGLPFHISVAVFDASATALTACAIWRLTGSRVGALLAFGLLLFCPQYFLLNRVLRENIYCFQILLYLSLMIFWLSSGRSFIWAIGAGLVFGWAWVTREDGIWLIPGTLLCLLLDEHRKSVRFRGALYFLVAAAMLPVGIGLVNRHHYGRWAIAEINDPAFVKAISATQAVSDGGRIPGVAVTKATRQILYNVSPTFATLRPVLESPGYFDFACSIASARCGEIGNGWWHWAVRYAAWQRGYHQTPMQAAAFYKQVRSDIEGACARRALHCDWRPISALPTMSWSDALLIPGYALQIMRTAFLIDPAYVLPEESEGTEAALGPMFNVLNRPPTFESRDFYSALLKRRSDFIHSYSFATLQNVLKVDRIVFFALGGLGIALVAWRLFQCKRPKFDTIQRVLAIIVVYGLSRISLLAIVGVTSFTTDNAMYIGPVYYLAALFVILVIVICADQESFALRRRPKRCSSPVV